MNAPDDERLWLLTRKQSDVPGKQGVEFSEVMEWINASPVTLKCDRFKELSDFKKAWLAFAKYPPSDCSLARSVHIDDVRRFLKVRIRPWKKAVKEITGKPDETKATAAFRSFLSEVIRQRHANEHVASNDEMVSQEVAVYIAKRKREGITVGETEKLREDYQTQPRRAPRKPSKKSL